MDDLDAVEVFAALFRRQYPALHRYLRRRVGLALAEDLAAQTFAEAYRHRGRFDWARSEAAPWLYGIAHNLLRHHRRQEERQLRAFARSGVDPVLADFADAAVDRVDAAGQGRRLAAALAQLKRRDREVLLLFAWAGLGYGEIAAALRIPEGTVRSRLNRARRLIRAGLDGDRPVAAGDGLEVFDGRA